MTPAEQAVNAIVARDGLTLTPEDQARLVTLYEELQAELSLLRSSEFAATEEPAVIYAARA
jgi:hypothetical protein